MDFFTRKRKGMELPINTVVILVILLVLVLVVLILVSRASYNFLDVGEDKIDASGSITNCKIVCWNCCHGQYEDCSETADKASKDIRLCKCIDNYKEEKSKC